MGYQSLWDRLMEYRVGKDPIMEPGFVKTDRDEELWQKAKAKAKEQNPDDFYALANHIYHKMKEANEEGSDLEETTIGSAIELIRRSLRTRQAVNVDGHRIDPFAASIILQIYDKLPQTEKSRLRSSPVGQLVKTAFNVTGKIGR